MSRVLDRPPSFLSRASLAVELDISDETEIDQLVTDGALPAPIEKDGISLWEWAAVERQLLNPTRRGVVYVIGFDSYVKIGFTSGDIKWRLAGLQTGCPAKLEIYATIPGTFRDERDLLRRFASSRTYGEWFRRENELAAWIEGGCK